MRLYTIVVYLDIVQYNISCKIPWSLVYSTEITIYPLHNTFGSDPLFRVSIKTNERTDVTIGHVLDMRHNFKRRNIQTMETKKTTQIRRTLPTRTFGICSNGCKYAGPITPNVVLTISSLQFLWILADNDAQTQLHQDLESLPNDVTTQGNNNSSYSIDYHWFINVNKHANIMTTDCDSSHVFLRQ